MALSDYYKPLTLKRLTRTDPLRKGDTFETVALFKGYIQRNGGTEAITKNEYGSRSTHTLFCPVDLLVKFGDQVVDAVGRVYSVNIPSEEDGVVSLGYHQEVGLVYGRSAN